MLINNFEKEIRNPELLEEEREGFRKKFSEAIQVFAENTAESDEGLAKESKRLLEEEKNLAKKTKDLANKERNLNLMEELLKEDKSDQS